VRWFLDCGWQAARFYAKLNWVSLAVRGRPSSRGGENMEMTRLEIYAVTVLICGISFLCFLMNQIHLDLKELQKSADRTMLKRPLISDRQGVLFSVLLICAAIIFVIFAWSIVKKGTLTP
jgi:hypothetical protein